MLIAKEYNQVHSAYLKHQISDCKTKFTLKGFKDQNVSSFLQYGQNVIKQLQKAGREGTAAAINDALKKISSIENKPFKPSEVTASRLSKWEAEMLSEGLKINSVASYMRSIRSVYNRAIKEGLFVPDINAFKVYQIRTEATRNRSITKEALKKLIRYRPESKTDYFHALNLFLLSFYLIGINIGDLLLVNNSNINKGRLNYKRRKTSKQYSIKLLPEALDILNQYGILNSGSSLYETITGSAPTRRGLSNYGIKVNKVLKSIAQELDIDEYICHYSARYTWVSIARDIGTPKDIISEALGHSYGNKVTGVYTENLSPELIDKSNALIVKSIVKNNILSFH